MQQEVLMQELGVDEVYIDRLSGKNTDRPELKKMMDYVRKGDTVIVESISRFARNTRDLLELIEKLTEKRRGVRQQERGNRYHDTNREVYADRFWRCCRIRARVYFAASARRHRHRQSTREIHRSQAD